MASRGLTLLVVVIAAIGFAALLLRAAPNTGSCETAPAAPGCAPSPTRFVPDLPRPTPTIPPVPLDTPGPSEIAPAPPPVGTSFDDEFDGTSLGHAWQTDWGPFGVTSWSRSHATVANGVLTITARRSGNRWTSGEIDTVGHFAQRYGSWYARILVPEGRALWATFWLAEGWRTSDNEVDIVEVCANPPGTADGNDATVAHNIIHLNDGRSAHHAGIVPDLTSGWHVFGLDWRRDLVVFTVDGRAVSEERDPNLIPNVPMSIVLDLAVGGWCGIPTDQTPDVARLQVDWVRVGP
jgi:beta-glucanase (GH16 family)